MRDHLGQFALSEDTRFAKGVLLLEDFSAALRWTPTAGVGDFVAANDTTDYDTPPQSLSMITRTTGAFTGDNLVVTKGLSYPPSNLLVARGRWKCWSATATATMIVNVRVANGTSLYTASLQAAVPSNHILLMDHTGSYDRQYAHAPGYVLGSWDQWEIVIDANTGQYLHLTAAGVASDPVNLYCLEVGADTTRFVTIDLSITAYTAPPAAANWDSIYVGEYLNI